MKSVILVEVYVEFGGKREEDESYFAKRQCIIQKHLRQFRKQKKLMKSAERSA